MDKAKSKTVIVIVGMPGAGKSLASSVAAKRGVPVFVSGNIIRAEAKRRNLSPSRKNIGRIMLKIRVGKLIAIADRVVENEDTKNDLKRRTARLLKTLPN